MLNPICLCIGKCVPGQTSVYAVKQKGLWQANVFFFLNNSVSGQTFGIVIKQIFRWESLFRLVQAIASLMKKQIL